MSKANLLISFSGGKTSAFMTYYILMNYADRFNDIAIVFANTGKEREETLIFVKQCETLFEQPIVWLEANVIHGKNISTSFNVVDFKTASRNGEPFEEVIKKYGIPNQAFPHCTRELKSNPIHNYIKSLGWKNYTTAIGIRADEMDRINWESAKQKRYWYPLSDDGITVRDVEKFWSVQSFTLNLQSYQGNCDMCWKKALPKLITIAKENPELVKWWENIETKYSNYRPSSRNKTIYPPPYYFGRGNMSIGRLINISDHSFTQLDLFEFGCKETCEPF